jgi:hypothetical protein
MRNDLLFKHAPVKDKTFCDIGAYDGDTCVLACGEGASKVVAIDYLINEKLKKRRELFSVLPMDIFSEKWFFLPKFDVVSCQGVFYHVPDVISLFQRLRFITKETLFLEGHFANKPGCFMEFLPGDILDENYSNWWLPTEECLHQMLKAVGFTSKTLAINSPRISILAKPKNGDLRKIMPRKIKYM